MVPVKIKTWDYNNRLRLQDNIIIPCAAGVSLIALEIKRSLDLRVGLFITEE